LDEFIEHNLGAWTRPAHKPAVAFVDFRADPEKHPLKTPSGKIEIFSKQLFDLNNPEEIPPIPKYIQEWESPFEDQATDTHGKDSKEKICVNPRPSVTSVSKKEYPLQAIGHHTLHRVHSTHDNNDWLEEAFPQRVFINPIDASARGIKDGDEVKVYNQRGALVLPCRITPRIMPGVVDIPQGAWYDPDENGVDRGGCINVLTSHRWTPFAFGTAQHTIMVEVEKAVEP
jgi:anaerobic dimethyl sulfoxide reductase subunit A